MGPALALLALLAFASTVMAQTRADSLTASALTLGATPPAFPAPKWSGYLMVRETYTRDASLTATLHRARIQIEGTLPNRFSYRALTELSAATGARTASAVSLRDAFARWSLAPFAMQAGQFKTPVSREYVLPLTSLEAVEFAAVVDSLAPKRDIGVMAEWSVPSASLSVGAFNGEGQNASANRDSTMLLIARATWRPIAMLSVGGSVARGDPDSLRYGAEVAAEWRGFAVRAEALGLHRRIRDRDDQGWYALATARVWPTLTLVTRFEEFRRPEFGPRRRLSAATAGVNLDLPGGRTRVLLDVISRRSGAARVQSQTVVGQLQLKF